MTAILVVNGRETESRGRPASRAVPWDRGKTAKREVCLVRKKLIKNWACKIFPQQKQS